VRREAGTAASRAGPPGRDEPDQGASDPYDARRELIPPGISLPAGATRDAVRTAVAALDPGGRLGAAVNPLFFALRALAPRAQAPRTVACLLSAPEHCALFLGLTGASGRWLAAAAGEVFARARRAELAGFVDGLGTAGLPAGPLAQVAAAVEACARSRPGAPVALSVQPLPFGSPGSGSGIAFSRDPVTGEPGLAGSFRPGGTGLELLAAGGEDLAEAAAGRPWGALLAHAAQAAERAAGHPVRLEFVVDGGQPWILSARPQALHGAARARTAGERGRRGETGARQAVLEVTEDDLAEALAPRADVRGLAVAAQGIGVSPGMASGTAVFGVAAAVRAVTPVVLVLPESRPEDLPGLLAAAAVVTERGGRTSHAGVVARGLGHPAVTALRGATVDPGAGRLLVASGPPVVAGDPLTVDGRTGVVYRGSPAAARPPAPGPPEAGDPVGWLLSRAAGLPRIGVRVNADTPADAESGRRAGAAGVGLCRVEHMFLGPRQRLLERVMLASRGPDSAEALDAVHDVLRGEFLAIMRAMDGLPVAIRLLDPPRHEFLPAWAPGPPAAGDTRGRDTGGGDSRGSHTGGDRRGGDPGGGDTDGGDTGGGDPLGGGPGLDADHLAAVRRLTERNPMLGVRGIRLGVLEPELTIVTLCALLEAAAGARQAGGRPRPELIVPMVSTPSEVDAVACLLAEARELTGEPAGDQPVPLGVMIETPRAALLAADLARRADFLSVGTNDLTALVWGMSRDDAESELLPAYGDLGVIAASPFGQLDQAGVGELIRQAITEARRVKPAMTVGVCGEHAAEPAAVRAFTRLGVDYVSCAPPLVPGTIFAAARARALAERQPGDPHPADRLNRAGRPG
jgi:pyruvate, orthophosphate dikinase